MLAANLFIVFVLGKLMVLVGHSAPASAWTPVAYFWQDAAVALAFSAVEAIVPKLARPLYWLLAIWAAINVPVGRALFTPLTLPMLGAARGPLADSLRLYMTWQNVGLVGLVIAAAGFLPHQWGRRSVFVVCLSLLTLLGPAAAHRVDTLGMDRNVVLALSRTSFSLSVPDSKREFSNSEDLSALRGFAKNRNVILISLESTAAQYLRLYGGADDLTPNLDRLAQNALVFDSAYAAYPESIKGLYSIVCSAYPTSQQSDCRSPAAEMARYGYRTALFHSGRFAYLGMEAVVRNRGFQTLEDAGDIGGNHNSSFGVDEPSTVAKMLSWIDALPPGQRFFLTYLPIAGHHPYETPERGPFPETTELGRYRNSIHYGDQSVGTLIEGLQARGLDHNTIWIILGDHGEAFGQHEGNYGHTFFLYEENVHVPFVIAAPGLVHGQTRVQRPVSLIDTAPTILDLLGVNIPAGYQGRSALTSRADPVYFFTDYSLHWVGLRDGCYKFLYELDSGRSKLFDLSRDPQEKFDLTALEPAKTASYRDLLRSFVGRCPNPSQLPPQSGELIQPQSVRAVR
jgi:hypothetical protein